jgi:RHH-type proline utilization regulon transcriptional repressor/proline dehydrogenase/delta 1-pyrroline-5-carboxylate dehydrogenase
MDARLGGIHTGAMSPTEPPVIATPAAVAADRAVAQVRAWLAVSHATKPSAGERLMARVLRQPGGLHYLTDVVDGVVRPEDGRIAAGELRRAAAHAGRYLPWPLAAATRAGAAVAVALPVPTAWAARRAIRALVGHLLVDARPRRLSRSLKRLHRTGVDVNVNLLGEAVLGAQEADRRVAAVGRLIRQADVDYVSIKVSATVAPCSPWDVEGATEQIVASLAPLYRTAGDHGGVFINLDMEEYRDLDLTLTVFERLMRLPEFYALSAGIVLQAYLPESMAALERIQTLATERVRAGGAPLRVRIVKGANVSMEHVEAEVRGWPVATWHSKVETDAQYKRLIDAALAPESTRTLKVGVAGHNLFDVAHAWGTATARGVVDDVQFEMLLGMGERVAPAVSRDVGRLRLYTPVVEPRDFDVALAYLVRRLEEVANPQNFLSRLATLETSPADFAREEAAFRESLALAEHAPSTRSHRARSASASSSPAFRNHPDSDPSQAPTRQWALATLARAATSTRGLAAVAPARCDTREDLDAAIARAHSAGLAWGATDPLDRARVLDAAAESVAARRGDLIEVMVSEAHKTIDQADPEVSEAIDFARYYAMSARELAHAAGAVPRPRPLTAVIPPWNFPVAIAAGSALAALAAGSAVVLKPAPAAVRCAAVLAEALWAAGIPRDALTLIDIDTEVLGEHLVSDQRIDQIILTGAYATAERLLAYRPQVRLFAETSGKNAMIITPSADLDLAVKDLVASAFGHAGQKCSAASLAILVGSTADSQRFRRQLLDAVRSLRVGPAHDPGSQMGPVIAPPHGKLLRGLTEVEPGETWWLQPERRGDQLWTPGVRAWVEPDTFFHQVECFGPVLGVMRARDLDHAIELANGTDYGLTAGLHTLDGQEILDWAGRIEAGNLYVNRAMTGAIVQRQPFGGWKGSAVGPTAKAGGPHYVATLTDWERADAAHAAPVTLAPAVESVVAASDASWVRAAAERDAVAWRERFSTGHDPTGLRTERNILRYCPVPTLVRWDGADASALARVCAVRALVGGGGDVSSSRPLPARLEDALSAAGVRVVVESDADALCRARASARGRVRVVGDVAAPWRGHADVAVLDGDVTGAPDLEVLPFVREQAVSLCAHRYGAPWMAGAHAADDLMRGEGNDATQ